MSNANLYALFLERFPSDPTAVFLDGVDGRCLRYSEVSQHSGQMLSLLQQSGVQKGDRVVVQVEKSIEAVLLYLACLRAGEVVVERFVIHPLLQHPHDPPVVHVIEKAFDVRFDNMVDRLKHDQVIKLLQCLMAVSFWTKAIRTGKKILLIDALKYPRDTTLDNLVFQCRYP